MSFDEYAAEREREEDRRERIRMEIYQAAARARVELKLGHKEAIEFAIELWDAMDELPRDKRPY